MNYRTKTLLKPTGLIFIKRLTMVLFTPENPNPVSENSTGTLVHASFCLLKRFIICMMLLVWGVGSVLGATITSTTSGGNWATPGTWVGGSVPGPGDDVNIDSGATVTLTGNTSCKSLTYIAGLLGETVNISTYTLNVTGAITMNGTSQTSALAVTQLTITTGTVSCTSLALNELFANSGTSNRCVKVTITTGTLSVSGDITIAFNSTKTGIIFSGSGLLNVGGNLMTTGGLLTSSTSTVNFNGAAQTIGNYTFNNLTLSGSGAKNTTSAKVNGILSMEGTATTTGTIPTYGAATTLQYKGSALQTTGTEFPSGTFTNPGVIIINNTNGVKLNEPKSISGIITLTNGVLNTNSYLLSITNNTPIAITGGSVTSYVSGPILWSLPNNASGSYNFPLGKGSSYLPFSLVATTSTPTSVQLEAFNTGSGGSADGSVLASISGTEYWSWITTSGFTSGSVSISTPQTATNLMNVIGTSTTVNGTYVTLGGLSGKNGVFNSNAIGGTPRFFVLASGNPSISSSKTTLTGLTYKEGTGPSAPKSFVVSGSFLPTNITITPPADFEISRGAGSPFIPVSVITLPVLNGVVANTTISTRLRAGILMNPTIGPENIVLSSGATSLNIACTGSVIAAPVISIDNSTFSGFNYNFLTGPSANQTLTVSGANLIDNIVITPPANFQISLTAVGGFTSSSITLPQTSGIVPSTPIYIQLIAGLVVNIYSGDISLISPFAATQLVHCSGSVTAPMVTVSTFNLSGFIYTFGSGPSVTQSVLVSGSNLTNNITVTAPANFEICKTSGGTYTSSITLTQSGGNVASTRIYVRLMKSLAVGTYGPSNLTAASAGSITQNVICSGQVVNSATLISSVTSLNGFTYLTGSGPSVSQSFSISGGSLTNDITVTCPTNFEISSDYGTTFTTGSITITKPAGNTINPTLIYIRLITNLPVNTYSANMVVSSGAITPITILCSGQVMNVPGITAGPAQNVSVCIGTTAVSLSSSFSGGVTNFYWKGPNGYYSQASNPTIPLAGGTVSATDAGTYTVTGSEFSGVNLLTNGGFELGNIGFGSSYGYVVPSVNALGPENLYTIVGDAPFLVPNNVHNNDNGFDNCGYHTGTHEMVINGAPVAGVIVWSESVSVVTGADYQFSYWIQSVNSAAPSILQLYVNGVPAGPLYTASSSTCNWTQFFYNVSSGGKNVLQLTLINQNIAASGNDFALDDMMFQQVFQTSATVNLAVNPNLTAGLTVTASGNSVYTNTPVTYIASSTNGGPTPAFQWSVGGVNVGTNDSTYTFTSLVPGTFTVKCVMTSSLPCTPTASAQQSLTVNARTNYWAGTNSTNWGDPTNWTAGFIPTPGNDVEYATPGNGAGITVNSLQLDQDRTIGSLINATKKGLIIPAAFGLTVNNTITPNNPDSLIYIKSGISHNGSLIYHNLPGSPVYGSVEMYSIASYNPGGPTDGKYKWQYFGIPLSSVPANPVFYGSYVRSWDETGSATNTHWVSLTNDSILKPFLGYEITQQSAKTILFHGQLVNSDFDAGQLSVTTTALYPGQHIFANPYTAAIDIKQLLFGSDTEATVYLYNTGSYADWLPNGQNLPATSPGQYTAVPLSTAGTGSVPRQIPSMQGFLVKVMTPTSTANSTFGIPYNSVIMNNTDPQRAPGMKIQSVDNMVSTLIDLKGTNYSDRMWLFTEKGCSRNFDNSWDGPKIFGNALTPQIFAIEPDGNYQVDAVDNINNTILGFQAGSDTEYTMTFTHTNLATNYAALFLVDLVENRTIDITQSGSTYTFVSGSNPVPVKRFMIATRDIEKNAPDANTLVKIFSSGHVVFVQNLSKLNGEMVVYDITGHSLKRAIFGPLGITAIQLEAIPGAYVVNAATGNERVSKRVILGK
jgi:hypothetical protein